MKEYVDQLKLVLNEELEVYKKLLDITISKKDIIANNQIKELDQMTKVEQTLILQIGQLEESRETLTSNLKNHFGDQELNMQRLIDHLPEEDKDFLFDLREDLLKTLTVIDSENKLNKTLIEDSLEYVNFNLDLLTAVNNDGSYENTATEKEVGSRKNLFDVKI